MCIRDSSWGVFFMFSSVRQKVCLLTLLFLAFKLLFEKILHHLDVYKRQILEYFSSATQIGMTATPKETKYVSNIDYFGEPVYVLSLIHI